MITLKQALDETIRKIHTGYSSEEQTRAFYERECTVLLDQFCKAREQSEVFKSYLESRIDAAFEDFLEPTSCVARHTSSILIGMLAYKLHIESMQRERVQ